MTAPGPAPGISSSAPPVSSRPAARPWWLGLAVLGIGAVWLHGALAVPRGATYAVIGPGLFPAAVALALLLLGGLLLVQVARGERFVPQEAEGADPDRSASWPAFWLTAVGTVLPILVIRPLGFPVAAALAFALVARAFGSRRLAVDLGLGLALGIACWLLFSRLLGLPLPGLLPMLAPALGR